MLEPRADRQVAFEQRYAFRVFHAFAFAKIVMIPIFIKTKMRIKDKFHSQCAKCFVHNSLSKGDVFADLHNIVVLLQFCLAR